MKNKTKNTALCGCFTALSVVLMLFTTVIPVFMYVIPIVTGIIVLLAGELINKKWALGVYFATSFLSLILLTDKEAALTFVLFFGYYPIIKGYMEKMPKWLSVIVKLISFNVAAIAIGALSFLVFGVSGDEYNEFGKYTVPILLLMANIVFVLYDISLKKYDVLLVQSAKRLKKKLGIHK